MKKYTYLLIGPSIFIIVWWLISWLALTDSFLLPDPFEVLQKLLLLFRDRLIMDDLLSTLKRVAISFTIAVAIGFPLGLWLGLFERLYRSLEFIIDFFRSLPPIAIFPVFLILFGITDKSKIAAAAIASMFIIIFNTAHGVMRGKKSRILAAKIMGATKLQIFLKIIFWESLSQTFIGLRSAASMSLMVIIATEMFVGTRYGLGRKIMDFQITYEISSMYAVILLAGIIGYLLNLVFSSIERRFLHWVDK